MTRITPPKCPFYPNSPLSACYNGKNGQSRAGGAQKPHMGRMRMHSSKIDNSTEKRTCLDIWGYGLTNPLGGVMWTFGYTNPFVEDGPIDVYWGESDRFAAAVSELYDNVEKLASDAEMHEESHFAETLAAIRTIRDDPAYWYDEDQGEDMEFTDEIGEITYYVMDL